MLTIAAGTGLGADSNEPGPLRCRVEFTYALGTGCAPTRESTGSRQFSIQLSEAEQTTPPHGG